MMIRWLFTLLALTCMAYVFYYKIYDAESRQRPADKDLRVLIDSVRVNDSLNFYKFKYDDQADGRNNIFCQFAKTVCDCSAETANIQGQSIQGIRMISTDTIVVESRSGFEILKAPPGGYYFSDIRASDNPDSSKPIATGRYFRDICKKR